MPPFGLQIPSEVVNALRTLPSLGDRLKEVASHTRVLGGVSKDVGGIASDVQSVPRIEESVAAIVSDTKTLPEIAPAIAALAERIGGLEAQMAGLTDLLTQLVTSIGNLDSNVAALQVSMEPVGRLADKLPGSARRS